MIEKITLDELVEEVYADQLDILRDSDYSSKDKVERKEMIKEFILECETIEDLFLGLEKLNYSSSDAYEYILSFFVDS